MVAAMVVDLMVARAAGLAAGLAAEQVIASA